MKTVSNKAIVIGILSPLMVLTVITPVMAIEKPRVETSKASTCTHVVSLQASNQAKVQTHMGTMQTDFAQRLTKIATNKNEVDQKVAANRATARAKFEERIQKLESQTDLTADQKTAIETYATNMQLAETTREIAVDQARTEYRTALTATITSNQQMLTNAASTYDAAVKSAFETAKTDCTGGEAISTLRTSIKTARQTLESTRKESTIRTGIQQLATTRNEAIKTANEAFRKSATTYKSDLLAALKPTSE